MSKTAAYDIVQWFVFQAALDALDASDLPTAAIVVPARIAAPAHVGVVCGSFDPLTMGHDDIVKLLNPKPPETK